MLGMLGLGIQNKTPFFFIVDAILSSLWDETELERSTVGYD